MSLKNTNYTYECIQYHTTNVTYHEPTICSFLHGSSIVLNLSQHDYMTLQCRDLGNHSSRENDFKEVVFKKSIGINELLSMSSFA